MLDILGASVLLCDRLYFDRGKVTILGVGGTHINAEQDRITAYVTLQLPWPDGDDSLDVALEIWRQEDYGRDPAAKPRAMTSTTLQVHPPRRRPPGVPGAQHSLGMEIGVALAPESEYLAVVKVDGIAKGWAPFKTTRGREESVNAA